MLKSVRNCNALPYAMAFGLILFLAGISQPAALAQNSLGLGGGEQVIQPEGPFAGFLNWINEWQAYFFKSLRDAIAALREDPSNGWYLVGLSFAYGVFHAAGPGHGKVIISSYMLANEIAARRGIALSFASAVLQGVVAIVTMGVLAFILRGSGIRSGEVATVLEIISYALVTALGAWLIWRKIIKPVLKARVVKEAHDHLAAHVHASASVHSPAHAGHGHVRLKHHNNDHNSRAHHDHGHHHHHEHDHDDCGCGHDHAPDPSLLSGKKLKFKEAVSAVLSVGLRPCTGAIVVLAFAFLNGLYLAGIGATLAMSVGTGLTVATLAAMAVGAKSIALRIAGVQEASVFLHRVIEGTGALLVFSLGLLLLLAALPV